jgi:Arc/MetJ-type ribon-helix-helix transcriptional regulator
MTLKSIRADRITGDIMARKARLNVTVDKELVDFLDSQVETQRFRTRSHGVEVALLKLKESSQTS